MRAGLQAPAAAAEDQPGQVQERVSNIQGLGFRV